MSLVRRTQNPSYVLRPPYDTTHEYNAISVGSPRQLPPLTNRQEMVVQQELVPVIQSDIPHRIETLEERISVSFFPAISTIMN